jgi:integrase
LASQLLADSFATYHIAAYQDSGKTARMLGHANPELTFRHYAALRSKEEAEDFWAIFPPESAGEES